MIAIDLGPFGERVSSGLQRSFLLDPDDVVVLSEDETDTCGADVLVTLQPDNQRLERILTPRIRWIHVLSAGVDGFPFDLLESRVLTCSRGASATAISEFVLAAMLSFEKQLPDQWISGPDDWQQKQLGQLAGRTLGLLGIGAIGIAIAQRAQAFDMKIVAHRRTSKPSPVPGVTLVEALDELLVASDHLVVAAPATPATRHILDAKAFTIVKECAHLVNIFARGTLLDQEALLDALDDGRLAMATLDVTDPEPLPAGHRLYSHPRARVSPHVSWSAPETQVRSIELFMENVRLHLTGQPLQGLVDVTAGY